MLDIGWIAATFLGFLLLLGLSSAEEVDYSQFVNPFIGSEGAIRGYACEYRCQIGFVGVLSLQCLDGGGDIFVGGAVPFGMVKLGIDTYEEPVNQSALNGGWTPKGWVTGISMLHESGTGGGPKYGWTSWDTKWAELRLTREQGSQLRCHWRVLRMSICWTIAHIGNEG
jgi:hypothetical protein